MVSLILGILKTVAFIPEGSTVAALACLISWLIVTSVSPDESGSRGSDFDLEGEEMRDSISSPLSPIMAITASTATVAFSGTPMYKRVPSSYDSNSIVALSVSTSASTSPEAI